ncbi:FG-GAP repeat protein [Maioricimonas rarisocia]|uniref:FG-GAP repeat protein n=1 Tax=Maioricimonas rarisocia TaxID=2528026 RepID=A0A517Z7Z5_9PLAN|nr:VCBS repeat-containing protein [Maioricimonas rarisocia]QDU38594.1 FG-GAP repeat protein [Maioricimonas rarisocia]
MCAACRFRSNGLVAFLCVVQWAACWSAPARGDDDATSVEFEKVVLTNRYYCDGVATGDINHDGHVDIVAGPYWYAGPSFETAHEFYPAEPLEPAASPSNSMYSFVHDFSGDGWLDILVVGRVHKHPAYWYENPGKAGDEWQRHFAFERVRGESPTLADLDGDDRPELIAHWEGRWGWIAPDWSTPRSPWSFRPVGDPEDWDQFYHGEGVGDVNGDGRLDLLVNDGWYENTGQPDGLWPLHRGRFSQLEGGAQMFAWDIDSDGDSDVVSSLHAHEWGLAWFEQVTGEPDRGHEADVLSIGNSQFVQHRIMGDRSEEEQFGVAFSQPHALQIADIDGDGATDIVVGKRMWAHGPKGDVEPNHPPVVYWFQPVRDENGGVRFVPHLIDDQSGVGLQIATADVNGDGRIDVMTASKLGTFLFLNRTRGE